jgi:DJ-1/PfpI family protein
MVTSVCTGSLLLAGAGLLQGRPATTHWAYHRFLDRLGATYVPQRWVEDGRYLTGAGVSAGIDTALRLAAILTNDNVAGMIQLAIEYDPQPPHGGIDWPHADRDSFTFRVEGFAHQALDDHPELLARLLGSDPRS